MLFLIVLQENCGMSSDISTHNIQILNCEHQFDIDSYVVVIAIF